MKKTMVLLLSFLLAFALLGVQAEAQTVPITVATWTSNEGQLALLKSFVDEFAQLKGIKIEATFESIPFAEYNTKLLLELQGSNPPDLYWVLETSAPAFIASGNLSKLDEALKAWQPEDFAASSLALWQKDGSTYAVPFSTSPFVLLYNTTLFTDAGVTLPSELIAQNNWTWDAFRAIAKEIKDKTGVWGFQTVDGEGYGARVLHNLLPIIRALGGELWTANNEVFADSEASIAAVQLFHDMVYADQSVVPPGDQSDFYTGGAAMTVGQISRVSKLKDVTWQWDMAILPGNAPVIGQAALGAFSKGKNADLAAQLLAYMTSQSCVERMAGIWPPARKSVLESEAFLSSNAAIKPEQMKAAVAASIQVGKVLPSHELYPQIEVEAKMIYDKLWNSGADVAAVMKEVAALYRSYIK
ncbi:MAG: sugar ABC transporter substrate-binding protein [Christensenellales bacterium]